MRPITQYVSLFVAAVAMTAAWPMSAAAATDAFLKLGGVKGEAPGSARIGHEVLVKVDSWSWGATQTAATGAEKFGAVGGVRRDDNVTSPGDAASGLAPGKRPHKPISFTKPLDRGSVRVKVKFPWLECRVGAAFADAVLQNAAGRYELKEVIITSCSSSGSGGDRPMESLSLNYAKVQVRGWDPKKKEE